MEVFCKSDGRDSKFFQGKFLWWTSISGWVHATRYLAFGKCSPWDFPLFLEKEKKIYRWHIKIEASSHYSLALKVQIFPQSEHI